MAMTRAFYVGMSIAGVLCASNAWAGAFVSMPPVAVRQIYGTDHYSQVSCVEKCNFEVRYRGKEQKFDFKYDFADNFVDIKSYNYFEISPGNIASVSFEVLCKEEYLRRLPGYDEGSVRCYIIFEPKQGFLVPISIRIFGINGNSSREEFINFPDLDP